jgi:K+-transporting ATPase ATPase C chain
MMFLVLTGITGFVYPLFMTGVAMALFPKEAGGSLIRENGAVTGSTLIGQHFDSPKYFWSRPSATVPIPYNASSSSGSNLGPLNPARRQAMDARRQWLIRSDPEHKVDVPIDLLTSSASGLDPHISPLSAEYQARRIAVARGLDIGAIRALVARHTKARRWGFLGEPVVNVVSLNRELDGK